MRQRDPGCCKCTWSKAQRSTFSSTISWRSFFMLLLPPGIGSGQKGTGLAETERELPEQPLALAHAQLDSIGFLDPMPTASCHPRDGPASPHRSVFAATPDGFLSPVFGSVGAGVRIAFPRSDRPVPADRSGETNTPPHAVRRPAVEPPPGTSCPARPAGRP